MASVPSLSATPYTRAAAAATASQAPSSIENRVQTSAAVLSTSAAHIENVTRKISSLSIQDCPFLTHLLSHKIAIDHCEPPDASHEVDLLLASLYNGFHETSSGVSFSHELSTTLTMPMRLFLKSHLIALATNSDQTQLKISYTQDCQKFSHCTLSHVSVAVLLGDLELVEALLKLNCSPNEPDNQGYTACHMAAVCNPALLKFLFLHGANFNAKTDQGVTVYDILKARGFGIAPTIACTVLDQKITIDQVANLIGKEYLHDNFYSIDAMMIVWRSCLQITAPSTVFSEHIIDQFLNISEEAPFVSPVSVHRIASPHPLQGQLELRADCNIAAGQLVGMYTGEMVSPTDANTHNSHMLLNDLWIDPSRKGSFIALANHGAPNIYAVGFTCKGFPHLAYAAIRPIAAGEPLQIDYGAVYFQSNKDLLCYEINPHSIEEFIASTNGLTEFCYVVEKREEGYFEKLVVIKNKALKRVSRPLSADYRFKVLYTSRMCEYLFYFSNHLIALMIKKQLTKQALLHFFALCMKGELFTITKDAQLRYTKLERALKT